MKWEKRQDRNFHKILATLVKENRGEEAGLGGVEATGQEAMCILHGEGLLGPRMSQ